MWIAYAHPANTPLSTSCRRIGKTPTPPASAVATAAVTEKIMALQRSTLRAMDCPLISSLPLFLIFSLVCAVATGGMESGEGSMSLGEHLRVSLQRAEHGAQLAAADGDYDLRSSGLSVTKAVSLRPLARFHIPAVESCGWNFVCVLKETVFGCRNRKVRRVRVVSHGPFPA